MDIESLQKVKDLQEQYDKTKSIIQNQERQIIQFLVSKNRQLIHDNTQLRSEIKTLRDENYRWQTEIQSLSNYRQEFYRPFQTEAFMWIPGDTSPMTFLSPNNLSSTSIDMTWDLTFEEYVADVTKVLETLKKVVNRDQNQIKQLSTKVCDLKILNEQIWNEVHILRKRNNTLQTGPGLPKPNTPNYGKIQRFGSSSFIHSSISPKDRNSTSASVWSVRGDSPDSLL